MEILLIILLLIAIIVTIAIFYFNAYNKINVIKIKMDNANDKITNDLKEKHELMNKLYSQIKKIVKKKDYLKDFNSLKNQKLSNYELDKELASHLETMKNFKEDYKDLNNDDFNDTLQTIKEIDQNITASKKFFNKNNNSLIKQLKGYTKIVAKINHISVKTSYEIKEPKKD
ncbi:MAG: LemA family protein [Firmicutes bacterium]|nr:LemA family protein [Bacillota bacterium]